MTPRTSRTRLLRCADYLQKGKRTKAMDAVHAKYLREIAEDYRDGMDIADGDLAKVLHRARWAR